MQGTAISEVVSLSKSEKLSSDFEEFRIKVLTNLASELAVDFVAYWHCDEAENRFTCLDQVDRNGHHIRPLTSLKDEPFLQLNKRFHSQEILIFRKRSEAENLECCKDILSPKTQGWMCLPLFISDELQGFVSVQTNRKRVWDIEDQHVLLSSGLLIKQSYIEHFHANPTTYGPDGQLPLLNNKQIADLVFYTVHNLRHPATNLMSLINILDDQKLDEESDEILDLMKLEAMKLDEVIKIMIAKLEDK